MIVSDGGLASGGRIDLAGIPGSIATAGTTQTGTLRVEDGGQELRCALAWVEDAGDALAHDLDLEMVSPSGKVYFGNFFTEDVDGDGILDAGENCHDRGLPTRWMRRSGASRPTPAAPSPGRGATPGTRWRPSSSHPDGWRQVEVGRLDAAGDLPDRHGQPAVRRQLLRPGRHRILGSLRPGRVRLLGQARSPGQRVHRRPRRRRPARRKSGRGRRSRSSTCCNGSMRTAAGRHRPRQRDRRG